MPAAVVAVVLLTPHIKAEKLAALALSSFATSTLMTQPYLQPAHQL
jgi:hypothetical protein